MVFYRTIIEIVAPLLARRFKPGVSVAVSAFLFSSDVNFGFFGLICSLIY
jgi:hypothetical protein